MIVRLFVFSAKAAMMSPFWRAVSYGKLLIPYRNNASDFSFIIFCYSGLHFKLLDLGVAVGIGLGTKRQSLLLDEVPIGKFNRVVDQSSGSGAIQG